MKLTNTLLLNIAALPLLATSQNVTVPPTCENGDMPANDIVNITLPYPYASVLSIIGSYKNLTWSGNPDNTVTLNGTDNTPGTARTYDLAGAHVIETLITYDSPAGGPYYENHNVAPLVVPRPDDQGGNVTVYCQMDATNVTSTCDGMATVMTFTAECCSNNASAAAPLLHLLHSTDAMTVGTFLGGANFTSCAALAANMSGPGTYTGGATRPWGTDGFVTFALGLVFLGAALVL